ncbi:MAG: putative 2-dehydropantoate 2-reductase [Bacteroidaceae bacterium]|nr:putative 2-dehydropantoate 2-reductase [Bacteroidaceae bacterium]
MEKLKYAVVGTGAIGGFYGAKLANAGNEVHFLMHSDYDYVRQRGLRVSSCDGDFTLPEVSAYSSTEDMPKADVVLVGLKSTNQHLLRTLLPPLLHSDTLVILIQNGIGLEADVQEWFPGLALAAGLAFICSAKTDPGHIRHQCYGSINLGNYSCSNDELFQAVLRDFCLAGIDAHEVNYAEARWRKAVWNMPFNGMTVALQTQTDRLLGNPATRQLIYDQMMEVIGAANALGINNIDESFAQKMMQMTDEMVPYSPSMRLDFDFHRPMEIHYIYTRPIAEAHAAGIPMPRLQMLERELLFIDSHNH